MAGKRRPTRPPGVAIDEHARQMFIGGLGGSLESPRPIDPDYFPEANFLGNGSAAILFKTDEFTLTSATQTIELTYIPMDHSEHVYLHNSAAGGVYKEEITQGWTRAEGTKTISITAPLGAQAGDVVVVSYAYYANQPAPSEWILPPQIELDVAWPDMSYNSYGCSIMNSPSLADPAQAASFYGGAYESHPYSANPSWVTVLWESSSGPLYRRWDGMLALSLSWYNEDSIDYIPPDLPPGATVEYRGTSEVIEFNVSMMMSGPALSNMDFRIPATTRPSLSDWNYDGPPLAVPRHAEVTPSGKLLASIPPDPGGGYSNEVSMVLTVESGDVTRTDNVWGPSWEIAVLMTMSGIGIPSLAVPSGWTNSLGSIWPNTVLAQPREYRVVYL